MKKVFSIIIAGLMVSAQVFAVTPKDVCGQFKGDLNIMGEIVPDKDIYLLPGVEANTLTFVLPHFGFLGLDLGNIVQPNIRVAEDGTLSVDSTTMYMGEPLNMRVGISILEEYTDEENEGAKYYSTVSPEKGQVVLSIAVPDLGDIIVIFEGNKVANNNYALNNGGFEGDWTDNEPQGWHSFVSASGILANVIKGNTEQFVSSTDVRPGSKGSQSALLSSKMVLGQKANGTCTNGRVNGGSTNAADATGTPENGAGNYNYSDPESTGFNTAFNGRPDSIVFWAKYQPADGNIANEANQARVNAVITTNARYQDPETTDEHAAARIGAATLNYSAVEGLGWQRLAVPFEYDEQKAEQVPAYILTTFTTNKTPAGGTSTKNVLDSLYLDDVELVYNRELKSFRIDDNVLSFDKKTATVNDEYCDSCATYIAETEGVSAQSFIAFDNANKLFYIYVIADDYPQSGKYNLYRVLFNDSDAPEPSAVDNVNVRNTHIEKIMLNGQLLIRNGENWYDIYGRIVK